MVWLQALGPGTHADPVDAPTETGDVTTKQAASTVNRTNKRLIMDTPSQLFQLADRTSCILATNLERSNRPLDPVSARGFEPPRPFGHQLLRLARLPFRHADAVKQYPRVSGSRSSPARCRPPARSRRPGPES